MIKANYHTHTTLCDGNDTPEDVVRYAIRLGMTHLGFSGHMDPDIHMDWPVYVAEISRLKQKYAGKIDIICGVELDNLYDPSCAPGAEYVIGSTHFLDLKCEVPVSVDNTAQMMVQMCDDYYSGDYYALSRAYYAFESKVYDRLHPTFIGHFDLVTRFNDQLHFLDEEDPRYYKPALEAMEYLVKKGVPFEINCGAVNRGRKAQLYPNMRLLRALHEFGGEILISSDAHQKELLLGAFDQAAAAATACGFDHVNYLTHNDRGKVVMQQTGFDQFMV